MSSSESEEADVKPIKLETLEQQRPAPNAVYHNFLNANNKFTEMLKNKIKQSGISPIAKSKINNCNYDFNPIASSTQIGTPNEVKHARKNLPSNIKALKLNKLSSYKESSSDEDTNKSKKTIIEISSTVADNTTSSEDSDDLKGKKIQKHLIKEEKSEISSNTDSDDSSQHSRQIKSKKNNVQQIRGTSSLNTNKKKPKKKEVSSELNSSDSENETTIPRAQKKTHKRKDSSSLESKEIMSKSIVKASTSAQSSSSSEKEEKENAKFGKKNLKKDDSTSSSESEEKNKDKRPQKQIKGKEPLKVRKTSSNSSSYSSGDEFIAEKVKSQIDSPDERLKSYENEASLQRIRDMNNFLNKIKPKEELFLLQVPIKLDPNSLVGVNISLSEQMRISQHKKYESVPLPKSQETLSLFCNDDDDERIHIVKPMGYIRIQRHLKKQLVKDASEINDNPVLFPNDLKKRHPLFGSDYTNKINLEENIKQKLAAAVESYNKKKKKELKEKKKKRSTGDNQEEEEIFKFLSQASDGSASKKAKNSMNESGDFQETYSEIELDASTSYGCKKKKKKKDKRNRSFDEDDIMGGKKRKKDLDSDVKGTKAGKFESPNESSLIQQLLFNETETLYKKKKKKRKKSKIEDE